MTLRSFSTSKLFHNHVPDSLACNGKDGSPAIDRVHLAGCGTSASPDCIDAFSQEGAGLVTSVIKFYTRPAGHAVSMTGVQLQVSESLN